MVLTEAQRHGGPAERRAPNARMGRQEWKRDWEATQRSRSEPLVPFTRAHATRKRFHDAASVPSVSPVRERPEARRRQSCSSGPDSRTSDPDSTTKSTKNTKKQSTRRLKGAGTWCLRSRRRAHADFGTGLAQLALRALRVLRGKPCLRNPPAARVVPRVPRALLPEGAAFTAGLRTNGDPREGVPGAAAAAFASSVAAARSVDPPGSTRSVC